MIGNLDYVLYNFLGRVIGFFSFIVKEKENTGEKCENLGRGIRQYVR